MRRHETPIDIANALAEHGPHMVARILDPAVGNGVLLEPFIRRSRPGFEAFAIDNDPRPLMSLRGKLGLASGNQLKIVHADFLEWACLYIQGQGEVFDCVVMNPPFAGQRKKWRSLVGLNSLLGLNSAPDLGPVEVGFILGAISLLRQGGRLLAVLPASVLTAPSCGWVRGVLTSTGSIRHVHELPRFAFRDIESRIYLVVYERGGRQRKTILLNHDLDHPERMVVEREVVISGDRLDFAYHSSVAAFGVLRRRSSLDWRILFDLATVRRGTEKTPKIGRSVIHTSNNVGGFWEGFEAGRMGLARSKSLRIRAGDILVRRVSRNCARSFGVGVGVRGARVSDCVLVIRPRYGVSTVKLLFAIRCLMALDFGPGLLEMGTGASYISQRELEALEIPYGLSGEFGKHFWLYSRALRARSFKAMHFLEQAVAARLFETPRI